MNKKHFLTRRSAMVLAGQSALLAPMAARAQQPTTPTSIRIINTAGNSTFILQDLLQSQGILASFGLNATNTNVADGKKAVAAVLDGKVDVCMQAGASPVFPLIEQGAALRIISAGDLLPPQTVYSAKPEIKMLKDLVGRTVGTGPLGAAMHLKMVALLRKKGVDASKVKFVNIGSTAAIFKAVTAGTVDAGPSDINFYADQAKYGVHSLTDANMWTELPEFTDQAAFTSVDSIKKNRDALVRAIAAYAKLYRFIQSPRSKAVWMATSARIFKTSPTAVDPQWQFYNDAKPYAPKIALSPDRVAYMQQINVSLGLQKAVLPYDQVVDTTLAADALKLIGG